MTPDREAGPAQTGVRDEPRAAGASHEPRAVGAPHDDHGLLADLRTLADAKGHPTDNGRLALARLDRAIASGELVPTPFLEQAIADLRTALAADEGQRLGGKSGEASRFILRAIVANLSRG